MLRCLRGDRRPFALVGAWFGGGAVLGSDPVAIAASGDDPFELFDRHTQAEPAPEGAVGGGWVGYLGYGLRRGVEPWAPPPPRPEPLPDFALAFYDNVLRLDDAGTWWFEALSTPGREAGLRARLEDLQRRFASPPEPRGASTAGWRWSPSAAGHAGAVAACVERIHAGDLYQANLAMRLEGRVAGDPLDLFVSANAALPTDRAAFVAGPWGAVASLSPELFLSRRGRRVVSAPIKGTRPDAPERLAASEKDRAENVMIVDLVRNDLGRVCEPGSVRVEALGEVRPHAGVWHMVSEVAGTLREGVGDGGLVRAAFPPGSVTGAPKIAAMSVIAELESTGREAYTGSIGMASPAAGLELNVAIRTLEARGGRIWLGAGGGVVADSDPQAEAREAIEKARPILAAAGGAVPADGLESAPAPRVERRAPRPTPRPDPAAGLFETVLVRDGAAADLDAHLARLGSSVEALYDLALPAGVRASVAAAVRGIGAQSRLRISAVPRDGGVRVALDVAALEPWRAPVALAPVVVPGGIGAHKWLDRRLLEELERAAAPALPLLVDLDGDLLETSRTNVFATIGGRLVTPPCDGRILPGVARARVIAERAVEERSLRLEELREAEAVYVTSALRGLHPASGARAGRLAGSTTLGRP